MKIAFGAAMTIIREFTQAGLSLFTTDNSTNKIDSTAMTIDRVLI